jgi:hypothetical protein
MEALIRISALSGCNAHAELTCSSIGAAARRADRNPGDPSPNPMVPPSWKFPSSPPAAAASGTLGVAAALSCRTKHRAHVDICIPVTLFAPASVGRTSTLAIPTYGTCAPSAKSVGVLSRCHPGHISRWCPQRTERNPCAGSGLRVPLLCSVVCQGCVGGD